MTINEAPERNELNDARTKTEREAAHPDRIYGVLSRGLMANY
jgi:hypothetical protein